MRRNLMIDEASGSSMSVPTPFFCARIGPTFRSCLLGLSLGSAVAVSGQSVDVPGSLVREGSGDDALKMTAVEVSASRVAASDVEGPQAIEQYDSASIEQTGAFTVNEFIDTLPPGADGDELLVLIDGQPAYLDPSMLSLAMIESIEVSVEGSMPQYGARAKGRVLNIRLKKDYSGRELSGRAQWSFAGGGGRWDGSVSGGEMHGKLRVFYSLNHSQSQPLSALDRVVSAQQDRRATGGSDLRLEWGYPAVVQARDGQLGDLMGPDGEPLTAALVPEGAMSTPVASAFESADPVLGAGAQGQRRFDTAAYRQLSSPSERTGGSINLNYTVNPRFNVALALSHNESSSASIAPPPVSPASSHTVVPAIYSPFGEDVAVGLVHVEFGPIQQHRNSQTTEAGVTASGRMGETWKWNGGFGFREDRSQQAATDLDDEAFAAALAATDPAQRFNPFVDASVALVNAALYPALTVERRRNQVSQRQRLDLSTNGDTLAAPGGPVRLSFQGRANRRTWDRQTINPKKGGDTATSESRASYSVSSSANVPLVAKERLVRGVRRLEVEVSGQYETDDDGGSQREFETGLVWSPAKWLSLRARQSVETEQNAASLDLSEDSLTGETLLDPRRALLATSDVQVTRGSAIAAAPEQSKRNHFGMTLEPTFLPGFRVSANYAMRRRDPLFEDKFDAQDVINNEAAFPGRVVRADPTAEDLALGRPGRILAVDTTGGDAGAALSRDLNVSVDYRVPEMALGQFHLKVDARHVLESRYEIRPGLVFINEGSGKFNPPDWRIGGRVSWTRDGWTGSLRGEHTGTVTTNIVDDDLPSYTEFDLNFGYRWQQPFWGKFGKGVRVMTTIDNLFDREPPAADTLNGFRGGSAVGRSINLAVTVPL